MFYQILPFAIIVLSLAAISVLVYRRLPHAKKVVEHEKGAEGIAAVEMSVDRVDSAETVSDIAEDEPVVDMNLEPEVSRGDAVRSALQARIEKRRVAAAAVAVEKEQMLMEKKKVEMEEALTSEDEGSGVEEDVSTPVLVANAKAEVAEHGSEVEDSEMISSESAKDKALSFFAQRDSGESVGDAAVKPSIGERLRDVFTRGKSAESRAEAVQEITPQTAVAAARRNKSAVSRKDLEAFSKGAPTDDKKVLSGRVRAKTVSKARKSLKKTAVERAQQGVSVTSKKVPSAKTSSSGSVSRAVEAGTRAASVGARGVSSAEKVKRDGALVAAAAVGVGAKTAFSAVGKGLKWGVGQVRGLQRRKLSTALKRSQERERKEIAEKRERAREEQQRREALVRSFERTSTLLSRKKDEPGEIPAMPDVATDDEGAIDVRAKSTEDLVGLGSLKLDEGEYDVAVDVYSELVTRNAKNADAHFGLGRAFYEQEKLKEAKAAFDQAILSDFSYADAYFYVGRILAAQGVNRRAVNAYRQATEYDPKDAGKWYEYGRAQGKVGKFEDAMGSLLNAVSIEGDNVQYLQALLKVYHKLGRRDAAGELKKKIAEAEAISR